MNDFTQEELVLIACWSGSRFELVGGHQAKEEGTFALSHKIQEMIIDYCEHPDTKTVSECKKCMVAEYMCTKCGHIFYEGI